MHITAARAVFLRLFENFANLAIQGRKKCFALQFAHRVDPNDLSHSMLLRSQQKRLSVLRVLPGKMQM